MFIPPQKHIVKKEQETSMKSEVFLESSHICISKGIVDKLYGDSLNTYLVYYPKKNALMLAPVTEELFKTIHKASQHMLKLKGLDGSKSIAIHELLIDNEIDRVDGPLEYKLEEPINTLTITL